MFAVGAIGLLGVGGIISGLTVDDEAWRLPLMLGGGLEILIAAALLAAIPVIAGRESRSRAAPPSPPSAPAGSAEQLTRIEHLLHQVTDLLSLREEARRALYPDRELEIIQSQLDHALALHDFAAAEGVLSCAQVLGHERALPDLRGRIAQAKRQNQHEQAAGPMQMFEAAVQQRDWAAAYRHAADVRAIVPDPATTSHLEQRVQAAREEHKRDLEQRFLDASNRDDVESAMAVLKELDRYMSREEAERLNRDAQRIIQRHRERLSTSFQMAVQEKRWADAARVGNTIVAEYPNTRMADEVRRMIEVIRTRATQEALARPS